MQRFWRCFVQNVTFIETIQDNTIQKYQYNTKKILWFCAHYFEVNPGRFCSESEEIFV